MSLLVVVTVAGALVSASGAATTRAQKVARIDVSTRAAVVKYLRSVHVNPKGAVIQRGARNYAGRGCLGKGWSCANTRHAVVQIAPRGGQNRFVCGTSKCVVVQLVGVSGGTYVLGRTLQSTAATATNTAKCVYTSGFVQLCAIIQLSSRANNVAVVYQQENSSSGLTQAAASGAAIIQRATGASNTNTACVYQAISLADSRTTSSGGRNIWLGAHQNVTIAQDSAHGGNSAAASATSAGGCTGSAITQSQTLKSTATGHGAITQNENSASLGPNVSLDVEQNQSSGFKGHATGTNSVVFNQTSNLQAVANTPNGPVSQTQSSPDTNLPYSGLVGTINQDSSGISTASATQTETQCEDAATSGLTTCKTGSGDADFNGTYALNQTQYGPEGIWQAPKHRSGHRRVPFVHKGYGTATQTGNSGDTFTINQSSQQDNDTGSGQTNVLQGDCNTSGNCTVTQNTDINGTPSTNTQAGSDVDTSTDCTGSSCSTTCTGPTCTTFSESGSQLTAMNVDVREFGYGGMRDYTGTDSTGDGIGMIAVNGVTGPVTKALLFWNGPTSVDDLNSNADVSFADTPITGTNIGTASSNCWSGGQGPYTNSQSYEADVTDLVSGNGNYKLSNFIKTTGDTVTSDINGVTLVVFYNDGNTANYRNVVLWSGNDSNVASGTDPAGWDEALTGVPGSSSDGSLDLVVSDGQSFSDGAVLVNGTTIMGDGDIFQGDSTPAGPADASGDLWDVESFDLPSSLLTASSNTLNLTSGLASDCLSLVVAAANVPASAPVLESPVLPVQKQLASPLRQAPATVPSIGASGGFIRSK